MQLHARRAGLHVSSNRDRALAGRSWIGQGDGLLAYDVNLDGKIEGARELSLKMWDALMDMMDVDGFFELKKTRTDAPDPGARPDPV